MIKANELRLGNIVLYQSYPQEVRLSEIEIQQHIEKKLLHEIHGVDPFPLTSDILLSSGFDPLDQDGEYLGCVFQLQLSINGKSTRFTLHKDIHRDEYEFEHYFDESSKIRPHKPIQYIHQLQNLYFALYGEELNIVL